MQRNDIWYFGNKTTPTAPPTAMGPTEAPASAPAAAAAPAEPVAAPLVVTETIVINADTIIVGNLTLSANSSFVVVAGSKLTVQGCATLNGTLQVQVTQNVPTEVDIIEFDPTCSSGTFTTIEVVDQSPESSNGCGNRNVTATPQYSPSKVSMLFEVSDCGVNVPVVVGAVVGSVVGTIQNYLQISNFGFN